MPTSLVSIRSEDADFKRRLCLMWTAKAKASNQSSWRKPATPGRQRVGRPRRGEPAPFLVVEQQHCSVGPNRDHVLRSRSFTFFRKKAGQPEIGRESRRERKAPEKARDQNGAAPLFKNGDGPLRRRRASDRERVWV
ncbi:hypothetical protein L1887_55226 [Cichorium endivia]|nr:hypothetical protein L1887_55226 [Cichorium endivia]